MFAQVVEGEKMAGTNGTNKRRISGVDAFHGVVTLQGVGYDGIAGGAVLRLDLSVIFIISALIVSVVLLWWWHAGEHSLAGFNLKQLVLDFIS